MNCLLFYISFLLFHLVKCNDDDDINRFLFSEQQKFEFVDLSYTRDNKREMRHKVTRFCVDSPTSDKEESYLMYSVLPKTKTVETASLKNLILPLIIADISDKVAGDANFELEKLHLDYMLNNYFGRTYQPCLIVFKFGWSKYYAEGDKYYGTNSTYPGISEDVAKWITTSYKNVAGVGVDLPSIDPGRSSGQPALKTLTSAGLYALDHVKLDDYLPEASCTAVVLPTKTGESCSPYRLLAICPKSKMQPHQTLIHRL